MYRLHLQYFELFLKSVKSAHFNEIVYTISKSIKYLFFYKNIAEIFMTCFCNILCYVDYYS